VCIVVKRDDSGVVLGTLEIAPAIVGILGRGPVRVGLARDLAVGVCRIGDRLAAPVGPSDRGPSGVVFPALRCALG